MLPALLVVAVVFGLLLLARIGSARRAVLAPRWPALAFALAAFVALARGAIGPALWLACGAALAWVAAPALLRARQKSSVRASIDQADAQAYAVLGVPEGASEAEIRRAYRAKMAQAHPDRGGSHAAAARLTAARDRLLKKRV